MTFNHLSADPAILNGKPCIRGTRLSVDLILEWMASGASFEAIREEYPYVSQEALREVLKYAAHYLKHDIHIEISL